ncbi:MAG: FAD binding domain-containing protein, partial [Actinomycetota bacterium]
MHHVQQPGTIVSRVVTPGSLAEAFEALSEPDSRPIAGGTDLLIELAKGDHRGLQTLVDLTRIPQLDTITEQDGTITIGALVTHNQVVANPILQRAAAPLVQACREVGSPQLRNRATVAGNLVTASPANDSISALLALDAEITIASAAGQRQLPLAQFHTGFRQTALEPGELVTALSFPALAEPWRGVFLKLGLRKAQAISVVHLAVVARLDHPGLAPDADVDADADAD